MAHHQSGMQWTTPRRMGPCRKVVEVRSVEHALRAPSNNTYLLRADTPPLPPGPVWSAKGTRPQARAWGKKKKKEKKRPPPAALVLQLPRPLKARSWANQRVEGGGILAVALDAPAALARLIDTPTGSKKTTNDLLPSEPLPHTYFFRRAKSPSPEECQKVLAVVVVRA